MSELPVDLDTEDDPTTTEAGDPRRLRLVPEPVDLDAMYDDLDDDYQRDGWVIATDEEANRTLRRIGAVTREVDRLDLGAQIEHDRIERATTAAKTPLLNRISRDRAALENFMRNLVADDPGRKTYKLACGTLKKRVGAESVLVADPAAVEAWVSEDPVERRRFLRIKTEVDRAEIKAAVRSGSYQVDEHGRVFDPIGTADMPGVSIVRGDDTYTVEVGE